MAAKKEISEELVKKLASIQCPMTEIAEICECSVDTLERRFAGVIKRAKVEGKSAIRNHQFRIMTKKDSAQMAMFLGEEYLGQGKKSVTTGDMSPLQNFTEALRKRREEKEVKKE